MHKKNCNIKKLFVILHTSKKLKPNKMIPESLEKLHEDIINKNTYISRLKKEIENLDEIVKGYQTFSDDVYMIDNLKNLSQRMKNDLNALELACEGMNDFIESNIKE